MLSVHKEWETLLYSFRNHDHEGTKTAHDYLDPIYEKTSTWMKCADFCHSLCCILWNFFSSLLICPKFRLSFYLRSRQNRINKARPMSWRNEMILNWIESKMKETKTELENNFFIDFLDYSWKHPNANEMVRISFGTQTLSEYFYLATNGHSEPFVVFYLFDIFIVMHSAGRLNFACFLIAIKF